MRVFIGCSSYNTIPSKYYEDAKVVSKKCIDKGYDLVFGCSTRGLMGRVYNEFMNSNSHVLGVCSEFYKNDVKEVDCDTIIVPDTYEQLKEFCKCDKIIYLPGGYGTLCEMFSIINSVITGEAKRDIIIVNSYGFYDGIRDVINKIKEENFAKDFDFIKFVDNIDEIDNYV